MDGIHMPPTELDYNRGSTAYIRCRCMAVQELSWAVILEKWSVAASGSTLGIDLYHSGIIYQRQIWHQND